MNIQFVYSPIYRPIVDKLNFSVIAPTVSASSGSFSSPTLMFGFRMSQLTVATFRLFSSLSCEVLRRMWSSIFPICLPKASAFWNFSFSRFCLRNAESVNQTYLTFPVSLSSHLATYILLGSQTTPFQFPGATGLSFGRLSVMSSSRGPSFHLPRCGWSPRPAKRHEGSAVQFAISSFCPINFGDSRICL